MEIKSKKIETFGIRFFVDENGREIAHAYLYVLGNDLHERPFGFMEDLFVDENSRGSGIGTNLLRRIIDEARKQNCYKLICTSRNENGKVHELYEKTGFARYGLEFRMDFS